MVFRNALGSDKKWISALLSAAGLQTWYIKDNLSNVVIFPKVGCGCLCQRDGVFEIRGLCVKKKLRGKGFGMRILKNLINKARRKRLSMVYVRLENKNLAGFYEKFGFVAIPMRQCPVQTMMPGISVLPMRLSLV